MQIRVGENDEDVLPGIAAVQRRATSSASASTAQILASSLVSTPPVPAELAHRQAISSWWADGPQTRAVPVPPFVSATGFTGSQHVGGTTALVAGNGVVTRVLGGANEEFQFCLNPTNATSESTLTTTAQGTTFRNDQRRRRGLGHHPGRSPDDGFRRTGFHAGRTPRRNRLERFSFYLDTPVFHGVMNGTDVPAHQDLSDALNQGKLDGIILINRNSVEQEAWLRSQGIPVVCAEARCGAFTDSPGIVRFDYQELIRQ